MADSTNHFVLIHGACHGAWCWYKLAALLHSSGHRVTAVDLAGAGESLKRPEEVESFAHYISPLMDLLAALPSGERVILVGHNLGGVGISLAAEAFPENVAATVYLSGVLPGPAFPATEIYREYFRRHDHELQPEIVFDENNHPASVKMDHLFLFTKMYHCCSPEDMRLASMLVRPTNLFSKELEDVVLTEERFGSVRRVYVICKEDKQMTEEFQRWIISKTSVDEVMEIEGADHMVMLSKPQELFKTLVMVADKYY